MIGYAGKIIHINLNDLKVSKEMTSEYTECNGMVGVGYDIIFPQARLKRPNKDSTTLIFACNPLTDALVSLCNGKVVKLSISPPSHFALGRSNTPGPEEVDTYWGRELRFSGHDAIIIEGKAREPVYIFVNDDQVEIKPADFLWRMDVNETKSKICRDLNNNDIKIVTANPEIENHCLAKSSGIPAGNDAKGALLGIMMASKNLKAVAIKGTKRWSQIFRRYVRL